MGGWSTSCRRAAVAAGVAITCAVGAAVPASAAAEPDANDWGTVIPGAGCVQADAWLARVEGIGGSISTALFESHFPPTPQAPEKAGGGADLINLTIGGIGLGKASAAFTRSLGNRVPIDPGVASGATKEAPCSAHAEAGGGSIDVGIPYMESPLELAKSAWNTVASTMSSAFNSVWGSISGAATSAWNTVKGWFSRTGIPPERMAEIMVAELKRVPRDKLMRMNQAQFEQLFRTAMERELSKPGMRAQLRKAKAEAKAKRIPWSPIGVHVEAITTSATAEPGKPVALRGGAAAGYISSFGMKIVNIPKIWPVNFGVRIPSDRSLPVIAEAMTNEQVTTSHKGLPTLDSRGKYILDPTATSGYVTAIHASVLGSTAADATVGHAAVLRDPALSETPPCVITPGGRCARP